MQSSEDKNKCLSKRVDKHFKNKHKKSKFDNSFERSHHIRNMYCKQKMLGCISKLMDSRKMYDIDYYSLNLGTKCTGCGFVYEWRYDY